MLLHIKRLSDNIFFSETYDLGKNLVMANSDATKTILVAEDDVISLEMVSRTLRRLPIGTVLKAADGTEAIAQIEQAGGKVDAAILDFSMPLMHGLQVLKKIRIGETSARPGLPCMMLTGHTDAHLHRLAKALDANAFLQKPVTFDKLKEQLERIINENAKPSDPEAYRLVDVAPSVDAILERAAER